MVCQGCHEEMPFRLADGSYYFEAVEYCRAVEFEIPENHLALCPVCAAKWLYANGATPEALAAAVDGSEIPEIEVTLAGRAVQLRFVQTHFLDLKVVLDTALSPTTAQVPTASTMSAEYHASP